MTVAGAYVARLMIKIMKAWLPGFTSGMNLEELARHLEQARSWGNINEPNWFMGDGSSWDAH